jgi:Caspase domain
MKRRTFLQSGAVYGTVLGVGQLLERRPVQAVGLIPWGKFAVLMGVDRYPQAPLKGCVMDVELQANLLQHRFGFPPENIVRLTNQAVTIAALTQALADLRSRIQPDDLLVLHFSGKGTLAAGPALEPTLLLTADAPLRLTELAGLLKGSGTKQVITVLDTAFVRADGALPENQRSRSAGLDQPGLSPIRAVTLPGMALFANSSAVEIDAADFSAGQFTHELTQALWQATTPSTLDRTQLGTVTGSKREQQFLNGLLAERSRSRTIGALVNLDPTGTTGDVWLGGLTVAQLAGLNPPAQLQARAGQTLEITARQGLRATVRNLGETPLTGDSAIALRTQGDK